METLLIIMKEETKLLVERLSQLTDKLDVTTNGIPTAFVMADAAVHTIFDEPATMIESVKDMLKAMSEEQEFVAGVVLNAENNGLLVLFGVAPKPVIQPEPPVFISNKPGYV